MLCFRALDGTCGTEVGTDAEISGGEVGIDAEISEERLTTEQIQNRRGPHGRDC
jgi:hypothetical protein